MDKENSTAILAKRIKEERQKIALFSKNV